jgi:UDP-glucose 4-epimerase
MHILVTGGAGFIGSHLCDHLLEAGHSVVAVDDLSLGVRENLAHLQGRSDFAFEEMSVLSSEFFDLVGRGGFECVFHMAANSDIQAGSRDRQVDLDKTFMTTWKTLEAMGQHGIGQLVMASTSAIYGDVAEPTAEDYGPLIPVSFYGAAKLASEAYCSAYAHRSDIQTWVFRFPNVVGSRATHGVILDFVRRLIDEPSTLRVLGDGTQEKPYLYVHDLIRAMLLAWTNADPTPYEVFNVGPTTATRVRSIAEIVVDQMGLTGRAAIEYGSEPFGWPGDVPKFAYDLSKITALGWTASGASDDAVRRATADIIAEQTGR